ncbi:DUF2892 domain-containing protein [Terribacillus saccharophilus]|uniref:YgaP family membrane protein n=1 Tax=Terribacillus saccharophilus TaxID=361277 RepID=UPI003981F798
MKPNMGIIQAMIRITAGVSIVGYATAVLVTRPKKLMAHLALLAGAMKIAEGIVRYCPSMTIINQFLHKQDSQDQNQDSRGKEQDSQGE